MRVCHKFVTHPHLYLISLYSFTNDRKTFVWIAFYIMAP